MSTYHAVLKARELFSNIPQGASLFPSISSRMKYDFANEIKKLAMLLQNLVVAYLLL